MDFLQIKTFLEKQKAKLSPWLTDYNADKKYRRMGLQLHTFLILALNKDKWSFPQPGRFTVGQKELM